MGKQSGTIEILEKIGIAVGALAAFAVLLWIAIMAWRRCRREPQAAAASSTGSNSSVNGPAASSSGDSTTARAGSPPPTLEEFDVV